MTLTAGTRLGPYEIVSPLGAGGMGEVYRAHDSKLGRDVAIKVLPEVVANDPDRLARFEREAKLLASLNHPRIASVYGLEEARGARALVMELVEGPTLEERLRPGAIPFDETLAIAKQVAEALEAAHEKGIIHRDLKPANVKLTANGEVKVLDFGLAKALDPTGGAAGLASNSPTLMNSPTMTAAGTQLGVILGTAAYMSPEQARGKPVDRRADIWAFGCLVFEMLSGRRAFAGDETSDILAEILKGEPDWKALPPEAGARTLRVLRCCLEKDPRNRFRDAADVALELSAAAADDADRGVSSAAVSPRRASRLPWIVAAAGAAAALLAGAILLRQGSMSKAAAGEPESRLEIPLGQARAIALQDAPNVAISPDGRMLAIVAVDATGGQSHLELRALDSLAFSRLEGSEGAFAPFFSPDGRFIAFFAEGKLKKLSLRGGPSTTLADTPTPRGGAWGRDGTIVYSPIYASGLLRIPDAGGAPQKLGDPDAAKGERTYRWPQVLPNGKGVLFTIGWLTSPQSYDDAAIAVRVEATGEVRTLLRGGNMARFIPPDRLIFLRAGTLYAVSFDPERLAIRGEPSPVLEEVGGEPTSGAGYFAASENGTLVWLPGSMTSLRTLLTLVDRSGHAEHLPLPAQGFNQARFSPDGKRIAFNSGRGRGGVDGDIWIASAEGGDPTRLTFDGFNGAPIFSADGRSIAYSLTSGTNQGLFVRPIDGSSPARHVGEPSLQPRFPSAWSADGRMLAYTEIAQTPDIHLLDLATGTSRLFESDASLADFSPDGRYLVYMKLNPVPNVFVRPLEGDGKWQLSSIGGGYPTWLRQSHEIVFTEGLDQLVAVDAGTEPTFHAGTARRLFGGLERYNWRTYPLMNFAVTSDGRRLAFAEFENAASARSGLVVALHWADTLRTEKAP